MLALSVHHRGLGEGILGQSIISKYSEKFADGFSITGRKSCILGRIGQPVDTKFGLALKKDRDFELGVVASFHQCQGRRCSPAGNSLDYWSLA